MKITAVPVTADVTVRLINSGQGWRFWRWHGRNLEPIDVRPTDDECARIFQDPETAASYFRLQYGSQLGLPAAEIREEDVVPQTASRWGEDTRHRRSVPRGREHEEDGLDRGPDPGQGGDLRDEKNEIEKIAERRSTRPTRSL